MPWSSARLYSCLEEFPIKSPNLSHEVRLVLFIEPFPWLGYRIGALHDIMRHAAEVVHQQPPCCFSLTYLLTDMSSFVQIVTADFYIFALRRLF